MRLVRGGAGGPDEPALDVAVAGVLLRRASEDGSGPVLRVYRPRGPVLAFGRRDTLRPGFPAAAGAAREAGFTPVVRPQGGRAVAYTEHALIVDHIQPHPSFPMGMDERFAEYGELWAKVLRDLGVDARVGDVPGEYCPGAFSVNARGTVKLVGTAQRLVRRAWLFSAVAIHDDAERLVPVLDEVYRHLEVPFDTASVGSVRGESPSCSIADVEDAVVAAYGATETAELEPAVLAAARDRLADHTVTRATADPSPL